MSLHMVEIYLDMKALLDVLHHKKRLHHDDEDLGYGMHTWLREAFGELAPQPWRLWAGQGRPARLLGYGRHSASELRQALPDFASPSLAAVVPDPGRDIQSKILPGWDRGRRLGFEILAVPVGRKSRSGVEKDYYLLAMDQGKQASREEIYRSWLVRQMSPGAHVRRVDLVGFRLLKTWRRQRSGAAPSEQRFRPLIRPQALFRGELEVSDAEAFQRLLARGVGRHVAFGYGMLLLRPPRS